MSRRTKRRKRIRQEQERQKKAWLEYRQAHWDAINAAINAALSEPGTAVLATDAEKLREQLGPRPERFGQ